MMYEAEVTATEIKISGQSVLTSGSVKVDQVHFTFSPDWDGCARTAVFLSGSRHKSGKCQIYRTPTLRMHIDHGLDRFTNSCPGSSWRTSQHFTKIYLERK